MDDEITTMEIPFYNEESTLAMLLQSVAKVPIRKQIILVDDCSKDGSRAVMEQLAEADRVYACRRGCHHYSGCRPGI